MICLQFADCSHHSQERHMACWHKAVKNISHLPIQNLKLRGFQLGRIWNPERKKQMSCNSRSDRAKLTSGKRWFTIMVWASDLNILLLSCHLITCPASGIWNASSTGGGWWNLLAEPPCCRREVLRLLWEPGALQQVSLALWGHSSICLANDKESEGNNSVL